MDEKRSILKRAKLRISDFNGFTSFDLAENKSFDANEQKTIDKNQAFGNEENEDFLYDELKKCVNTYFISWAFDVCLFVLCILPLFEYLQILMSCDTKGCHLFFGAIWVNDQQSILSNLWKAD